MCRLLFINQFLSFKRGQYCSPGKKCDGVSERYIFGFSSQGSQSAMDPVPDSQQEGTPLQESGGPNTAAGLTLPIQEASTEPRNLLATPIMEKLEANPDFILLKEHSQEALAAASSGGGSKLTIEESKLLT